MEKDWKHLSQHTAFGLELLPLGYARQGNRINGLSPGAHPRPAHTLKSSAPETNLVVFCSPGHSKSLSPLVPQSLFPVLCLADN